MKHTDLTKRMAIATAIKEAQGDRRLEETCTAIGCSFASLINWRQARYVPDKKFWGAIKDKLGVDIAGIMGA